MKGMLAAGVCDICLKGDHSAHWIRYGGTCVGCLCEFRPAMKYNLSALWSEERSLRQQGGVTYGNDEWVSNGEVCVRRSAVDNAEQYKVKDLQPIPDINSMLAKRSKRFVDTGVTVGRAALFVAPDGDYRMVDEDFCDIFFDLEFVWGSDDVKTPLQNASTPADVTVLLMPMHPRPTAKRKEYLNRLVLASGALLRYRDDIVAIPIIKKAVRKPKVRKAK